MAARRGDAGHALRQIQGVSLIGGVHGLIYAEDADAARAFFRDVLGWEHVEAHEGWLIFALPPAELGLHPAGEETFPTGTHQLLLMCRDIAQTVAALREKGVEFADEVSDKGFGRLINMKIPGAGEIGLYEPKHPSPLATFR